MHKRLLCYIATFMLFTLLIIVNFDLYAIPQKTLNILFILGLIAFYSSKGSEE